MTCEEATLSLGAYVLGALEPEERRQMREHLSTCPVCAEEYADLEGLPAVLDRVTLDDLHSPSAVAPSPDLFDRVASAAAADEGRRMRRRWVLVAAAIVVLLVGGVGTVIWVNRDVTHSVVAGDVHVTVRTQPDDENVGTILDVRAAGLQPRERCQVVVTDENGMRHDAGWWKADPEGAASFQGWTNVPPSEVADLFLLDVQGETIVRVPI